MKWHRVFSYTGIFIAAFLLSAYFTLSVLLKTGETVICPDVRGKDVNEAKRLVESKGLSLAVTKYERRNDVPYNHITVQKPEANISIRKGRTVLTIVSEGPELVQIPALTGQLLAGAEEALKNINVEIEKTIYVPSQAVGKVVAQIPKGGESILQGQGVVLLVGVEQKALYMMPDVKTLDMSDLVFEMERKGIKHKVTFARQSGIGNSKPDLEASVPYRAIFKADDEIEIRAGNGG